MLQGLVAATHTPFHADGRLNLAVVEKQAEHLLRDGVKNVFIGGTTGESHSLSLEERLALAKRWVDVAHRTPMTVVVHVGSNCLADARTLAKQAQSLGAAAISAMSPSYFKPASIDALVACCAEVASAAPATPFYFYDIPSMTGVRHPMPDFLNAASERIPTLAGLKFTNPDLAAFQRCLHAGGGRFDVPWGTDEYLLAALSLGGTSAVGSTYNFAAPLYNRLVAAFEKQDLATARELQLRSVELVELLNGFGFMAAARALMTVLGIDVGPPRLPFQPLAPDSLDALCARLDESGLLAQIR